MDSFLPSTLARPVGRAASRRAAPASLLARFALQSLEDRSLMSSSIQLAGVGFKPIGPNLILNSSTADPTVTNAGRINGISAYPAPFDVNNPGFTGPTDPNDPAYPLFNTYFVATPGGGVARTTDSGKTWQFLTDNLPVASWGGVEQNRDLSIGAVAVAPLNPNLVLAGTGEAFGDGRFSFAGRGLLRSGDGGNTWALIKGPTNDFGNAAFDGVAFTKFVFHPTDANTVYAVVNANRSTYSAGGAQNGVYRSTDAGQTWELVTTNSGDNIFGTISGRNNITDFILDPTSPNVGYVAIANFGIVRTPNLQTGATYTVPGPGQFSIVLGGAGSTQLPGGSFGQFRLAFGLGKPGQPSRIYALVNNGGSTNALFRSDDSGINFRRLDVLPGDPGSTTPRFANAFGIYNTILLADPTSPNRLFIGGRGTGGLQVLLNADFNSDLGQTPNYVNLTAAFPQTAGDNFNTIRDARFDNTGAKDVNGFPTDPGRLLIATDSGVYRIQAPGNAVTTITNYTTGNLVRVNLNGDVGTQSLAAQQVFATGLAPRDDNTLLAGTYLNGTALFSDPGPLPTTSSAYPGLFGWNAITPVTGNTASSTRGSGGNVLYNTIDPTHAFRASNPNGFGTAIGDLFQRSTDSGSSFATSVTGIVNPGRIFPVVPFEIDPSPQVGTPDAKLYLGTDVLNRSTTDGVSWSQFGPDVNFVTNLPRGFSPKLTAISNGRSGQFPIYIAMDFRVGPNTIQGPAIYRWDGNTNPFSWRDVSPGALIHLLPPSNGGVSEPEPNNLIGEITDLTVDPTNSSIIYMTCDTPGTSGGFGGPVGSKRIWRSIDAGENWTDISGDLPETVADAPGLRVYTVALDPQRTNINPANPTDPVNQSDDDVYVGTTVGVYKLTNPVSSTNWTRVYGTGGNTGTDLVAGQLPDAMVRDIKINTTTGILSVATFGRGVWQTQIRPYVRGIVYDDATGNGAFDAAPTRPADAILPGVVVVANDLVPNPPVQFANTTSSVNGEYVFRSLPASNYSFLPADATTQLIDSASKYYFTSAPIIKSVNATTILNGQDQFVFRRVSISGKVYEDANGNSLLDGNENPGVGYRVELYAPAGTLNASKTLVAAVTTDAAGNYVFLGVGPLRDAAVGPANPFGSGYQVVLSKANYQTTETPTQTGFLTSGVSLADATNQNLTRIGAFKLGQIGGQVFNDTNGDGALNNAETGFAGFTVNILDAASNAVVATTVSAADGSYLFGDFVNTLRAGSYSIQVVDKAGFTRTTPPQAPLLVQSGTKTLGINVGEFAAANIFGNAFEDVNGNGVRDPGDGNPFAGVTVSLIDPRSKSVVQSTLTDAAGNYAFGNLAPLDLSGNKAPYLVEFTSPTATFAQTIADPSILLTAGSSNRADLPLFVRTSVTGFAFDDTNGNGQRDAGENGLAGGSVSLLNSATSGVVLTTVTGGDGNYTFTGVGPILGAVPYRVGANPAGFVQTTANPPDFTLTSNTPATVTVAIGLFRLASFSGTVFDDANGSGVLDAGEVGVPGRTVQLVNADTLAVAATATTDAAGKYALTAGPGRFVVQVAPVAGFVQTTPARAAVTTTSGLAVTNNNVGVFRLTAVTGNVYDDLNGNGVREAEPGLAGVAIQLVNATTNLVVGSATTDATGFFAIQGIGPGNYLVRETLRAGYVASTPTTQAFTPTSGTPTTFAFGSFLPTTVSGSVYEDLNRSNARDPGEIASPGFTVQLTRAGGILVASAVSDAAGAFGFGSLPPGVYTARVLNRQGFAVLTNGSQTVTVTSGTPVALAPVGTLKLGSLSGTVFLDTNRNGRLESFERGLAAGVVQLLDANGAEVAQAPTDANGLYTFLGLQTGTYTVKLLATPPGFALAPSGATTLTATTSVGSTSPDNAVAGLNFGLIGRRRYALAADGGGGPRVQIYDALTNTLLKDFFVYETTFAGGVRVAEADVNGDGIDDLIVAPGKGGGPRIRVISGADDSELYNYFAYEPSFVDGLFVTAADVNGDGYADIITGTDSGGGPRVTVFSGKAGVVIADFFAYDNTFRGGVRVGAGDLDGNGVAEILTAMGVGGTPLVKSFGGGDFRELGSFNAFDAGYTGGVFLANSSADPTTGRADVVVGSGVAFPTTPVVRTFDGLSFAQKSETEAFPSGGAADGFASEVRVSSLDRNGDNVPDIGIASGSGSVSRLRFVDGLNFRQIGDEVQPYESSFLGGIFIG